MITSADGSFDYSNRREILLFSYTPREGRYLTEELKREVEDRITKFLHETDEQLPVRHIPYAKDIFPDNPEIRSDTEWILEYHRRNAETRIITITSKVPHGLDLFKDNVAFNKRLRVLIDSEFVDTPFNEATPHDVIDMYLVGKCPQYYSSIGKAFADVCQTLKYEFSVHGRIGL